MALTKREEEVDMESNPTTVVGTSLEYRGIRKAVISSRYFCR